MLAAALGVMGWTLADPKLTHELALQIDVFCAGFFLACMFCHGELVTCKPAPRYLTRFYLMVSLGGALGSIAVGVVAPLVFSANFDLAIVLVACALLLLWQTRRRGARLSGAGRDCRWSSRSAAASGASSSSTGTPCYTSRNFYGDVARPGFRRATTSTAAVR